MEKPSSVVTGLMRGSTQAERNIFLPRSVCSTAVALSILMNLNDPSDLLIALLYTNGGVPADSLLSCSGDSFAMDPFLSLGPDAAFLFACSFSISFIIFSIWIAVSTHHLVGIAFIGMGTAPNTRKIRYTSSGLTVQFIEKTVSCRYFVVTSLAGCVHWSLASRNAACCRLTIPMDAGVQLLPH